MGTTVLVPDKTRDKAVNSRIQSTAMGDINTKQR